MNMKRMLRTMPVRIIRFPRLLLALLFLSFVHLPACTAQNVEPFTFLRDYVGLNEDQIAASRNGKSIAQVVESRTRHPVFLFGSVYVRPIPRKYYNLPSTLEQLPKRPRSL